MSSRNDDNDLVDCKESDDVLLQVHGSPHKESAILDSWAPEMRGSKSSVIVMSKERACSLVVLAIAGLLIAAVLGYVVGLLLGPKMSKTSVDETGSRSSKNTIWKSTSLSNLIVKPAFSENGDPSPKDAISPKISYIGMYNWGSEVLIDNSSRKITDVFASILQEADIQDFMGYGKLRSRSVVITLTVTSG